MFMHTCVQVFGKGIQDMTTVMCTKYDHISPSPPLLRCTLSDDELLEAGPTYMFDYTVILSLNSDI